MHVIQAPGVWLLLAHRMRLVAAVLVIPGVVAQLGFVVTEAVSALAARLTGVFPLAFRRQPATGPPAEDLGFFPRHTHDRLLGIVELAVAPLARRLDLGIGLQEPLVFLIRDLVFPQQERLRDANPVNWLFIAISGLRSQVELSRRNVDESDASARVHLDLARLEGGG